MNRREINRVRRACVELAESALLLKISLPAFALGGDPDWPCIADSVRHLRRRFEQVEALLGQTNPVRTDDIQWRLTKYDFPDADIAVLVSIAGDVDAREAYRDESDDRSEMIWRYSNGHPIYGQVYAWSEMPVSLRVRDHRTLALTWSEERRAS